VIGGRDQCSEYLVSNVVLSSDDCRCEGSGLAYEERGDFVQDIDCFAGGFFLGFCFVGWHDGVLSVVLLLIGLLSSCWFIHVHVV
jgi:hypothetical protein